MKGTDPRYSLVRSLIEAGKLTTFAEVFDHIPVAVVAADLEWEEEDVNLLIADPGQFRAQLVDDFAELFEVDIMVFADLVLKYYQQIRDAKWNELMRRPGLEN